MTSATIEQVKSGFDKFVKAAERSPVVVTRKGRPVAMLLGSKNADDIERLMMAYSPKLRAILDRSNAQIDAGRGIPVDKFWSELAVTTRAAGTKRAAKTVSRVARRRSAGQ